MTKPAFRLAAAALAAVCACAAPSLSWSQSSGVIAHYAEPAKEGSMFECEGGKKLFALFNTHDSQLFATVDTGDGPHELMLKPWDGGVPQITWSDGARTLTWSVGVQLMFVDGPTHLMCGRGEHHH